MLKVQTQGYLWPGAIYIQSCQPVMPFESWCLRAQGWLLINSLGTPPPPTHGQLKAPDPISALHVTDPACPESLHQAQGTGVPIAPTAQREAPLSTLTCCGEVLFCSPMMIRCLMEREDEEPLFLLFTGNALFFSSQLLRVPLSSLHRGLCPRL